ncbi:endolytic transglycosylase MltG [Neptunicella sp. SCSIO 80796]|uniref:endolytic transglycosylase MltG n=1 Tax=Neptunicella plasticusilytica TaxID=3117012 RepID=UPI003A4E3FFD
MTRVKIYLLLALLVGVSALLLNHQYQNYRHSVLANAQPMIIKIEKGQTAHGLINQLAKQQLLEKQIWSKVLFKLEPELAAIKSGTYELSTNMPLLSLLDMLRQGKEVHFPITLVEGLRWRDWRQQINNQARLSGEIPSDKQLIAQFELGTDSLEGWLMPDTYWFTDGYSRQQLIEQAFQAMQSYLQQAWQQRQGNLPYQSPYQALIMASIIEKETAVPEERPRIAAVFVNRLDKNMRLQTDPTVIYGLGENFDGNIRRADLRQLTPYNTYKIKGLPPTPIAMPGKLAIDAALQPDNSEELYFVARGDGSHQFSETLEQHNKAVREFQLKK